MVARCVCVYKPLKMSKDMFAIWHEGEEMTATSCQRSDHWTMITRQPTVISQQVLPPGGATLLSSNELGSVHLLSFHLLSGFLCHFTYSVKNA